MEIRKGVGQLVMARRRLSKDSEGLRNTGQHVDPVAPHDQTQLLLRKPFFTQGGNNPGKIAIISKPIQGLGPPAFLADPSP